MPQPQGAWAAQTCCACPSLAPLTASCGCCAELQDWARKILRLVQEYLLQHAAELQAHEAAVARALDPAAGGQRAGHASPTPLVT